MKDDIDIMEFRKDLFRRAKHRMDKMDKRNTAVEDKALKSFYSAGGDKGTAGFKIQQELLVKQDEAYLNTIDKLIKTTANEAKLQEKLNEAEREKKKVQQLLKKLEGGENER